jgi:hypothetical protein
MCVLRTRFDQKGLISVASDNTELANLSKHQIPLRRLRKSQSRTLLSDLNCRLLQQRLGHAPFVGGRVSTACKAQLNDKRRGFSYMRVCWSGVCMKRRAVVF